MGSAFLLYDRDARQTMSLEFNYVVALRLAGAWTTAAAAAASGKFTGNIILYLCFPPNVLLAGHTKSFLQLINRSKVVVVVVVVVVTSSSAKFHKF